MPTSAAPVTACHPAVGTQVRLTIAPVDENCDPLAGMIGIGEGRPDGAENHDKYLLDDSGQVSRLLRRQA